MVKPGGTGSFRRDISARLAPLPPSSSFMLARPSVLPAPKAYTYCAERRLFGRAACRRAGLRAAFALDLAIALLSPALAGRLSRRRRDPLADLGSQPILGDAHLRHRIAVAQRDGAVAHGVVVDRDAEGRPDLVLPAVAAADRTCLVVVDGEVAAEIGVDLAHALRLAFLPHEREDGGLVRREARVQAEHDPALTLDLILVERVDQEGQQRAVDAGRRLDHER